MNNLYVVNSGWQSPAETSLIGHNLSGIVVPHA